MGWRELAEPSELDPETRASVVNIRGFEKAYLFSFITWCSALSRAEMYSFKSSPIQYPLVYEQAILPLNPFVFQVV